MSLHKYASFAIQEAWWADQERPGAPMQTQAHRHEFAYDPRPGYLYVRSRAISSRCNDNFDEFPADEIKQSFRSFVGKPVFVNHHNDDHRRARGVVIDSALHEDVNPDGSPDTWAEVLMEVDAHRFPMLARAILAGEIDRTSMGCDVAYSVCSACGNKARTPTEYCHHIPRMKGKKFVRHNASTDKSEEVLIREVCHGLKFFENSLLVEDPADPTAYVVGVDDHSGMSTTAAAVDNPNLYPDGMWGGEDDFTLTGRPTYTTASDEPVTPTLNAHRVRSPETGRAKRGRWYYEITLGDQTVSAGFVGGSDEAAARFRERFGSTAKWRGKARTKLKCRVCRFAWNEDFEPGERDEVDCPRCGAMLAAGQVGYAMASAADVPEWKRDHESHDVQFVSTSWGEKAQCKTCEKVLAAWSGDDDEPLSYIPSGVTYTSKLGYGEQVAPPQVNTLRDEQCPVCGEKDSYSGDKCAVCGFIRPPDEFLDPDLDAAKENDLRQDQGQPTADSEQPDDPNAVPDQAADDLIFHPPADAQQEEAPAGEAPTPGEEEAEPEAEGEGDEDEEEPDEEEPEDSNKPDFLKKKKKGKPQPPHQSVRNSVAEGALSMRPTMTAFAEQQILIEAQERRLVNLERGMCAVARLAGLEDSVLKELLEGRAMIKDDQQNKLASVRRQADTENPAQPVPQPGSEAPSETKEDALGDLNGNDVTTPGSTSVTDVSPGATTSVDTVGTVLDTPLDLNEQDVTKPVEGTTEQAPLNEVKIETDVRHDTGDTTSTMFPLQGPFANQPTTSSAAVGQARTFAALRLARLRIQARIEQGDDLVLGERIAASDASNAAIQSEIETLSAVMSAKPPVPSVADEPRRTAGRAERNTPSFASTPTPHVAGRVSDDELLFEG